MPDNVVTTEDLTLRLVTMREVFIGETLALRELVMSRQELEIAAVRQQIKDLSVKLDERYETQSKALDTAYEAQKEALTNAFTTADKALQAALSATKEAIGKADAATDKRFESVNEFRQQLTAQELTFMPRQEYTALHEGLAEKVDVYSQRSSERIAAIELRLSKMAGLDSGVSETIADRRARISMTIAGLAAFAAIISVILFAVLKP